MEAKRGGRQHPAGESCRNLAGRACILARMTALSSQHALQSALKDALAAWASGVAVVGARDAEGDHGTTVSSFTSVSLEPPLVLVSLASSARIMAPIDASGRFSISVLAADQQAASAYLATRGRPPGFGPVPVARLDDDLPGVEGALAHRTCGVEARIPQGDHTLLVGRVTSASAEPTPRAALVYHQRGYRTL